MEQTHNTNSIYLTPYLSKHVEPSLIVKKNLSNIIFAKVISEIKRRTNDTSSFHLNNFLSILIKLIKDSLEKKNYESMKIK